jgi:hypothetical protein
MGRGEPGAVLRGGRDGASTTTCVTSGAGDEEMAIDEPDACSASLFGDSAAASLAPRS